MPLASALASIRQDDAEFADLLQEIFTARYTGSLILHCADGVPQVVEFPARQVRLAQLSRLDKPVDSRDAVPCRTDDDR